MCRNQSIDSHYESVDWFLYDGTIPLTFTVLICVNTVLILYYCVFDVDFENVLAATNIELFNFMKKRISTSLPPTVQ